MATSMYLGGNEDYTCDKFLLSEGPEKNISLNSKLRVCDNLKVVKHCLEF